MEIPNYLKSYTILDLPNGFLNEDAKQNYLHCFIEAKSVNEQIQAVKGIYLKSEGNSEISQFLSDLYFHCSINHPIRNQIAKLFDKNIENSKSYISKSIDNLLKITKDSCDIKDFKVVSLSGCLKNFPKGKEAMKSKDDKFLIFLYETLKEYLASFSQIKSASLRNKILLRIHNSIRSIILCIQEFKDTITFSTEQIDFLKKSSKILINSNDTLLDTKTNLGILLAHIQKICGKYYEYIVSVAKWMKSPIQDNYNLYKSVGIINVFLEEDFLKYPEELAMITKIISIAVKHSTNDTNIYLPAGRTLKKLSKNLLLYKKIENDHIKIILEILLDYSLLYIVHDMDSIRYICKDILHNIVQCYKKYELTDVMDCYFKSYFCTDSITIKCVIISSIASVVNCTQLTNKYPEIFENLFHDHLEDNNVSNLYEILMVKSFNELDFLTWKGLWIDFLLKLYNSKNLSQNIDYIEHLLNKAVACDVQIVNTVLDSNIRLSTKFSVMWTVKKNGLVFDKFENILQDVRNNFKLAFISECDNTKIMALRLLVETHKSTEIITEFECENILLFLLYNLNLQNPSTRSKVLRLLVKLLVRLEVNLSKSFENIYSISFLKELILLLNNNLFDGANFSRKSLSLNLLKHSIQILINRNLELSKYLPINFIDNIFKMLSDPYNTNKSLAVEILHLTKTSHKYESLITLKSLLISIRPSDSLAAAYHLEHICNIFLSKEAEIFFYANYEISKIRPTYYCALMWCLNILKNGINIAKKSILLASKFNPLYGSLFAIKHLILKLNFNEISTDNLWRSFLADLINTCKITCNIVKPIVNNSSPEGHLPNDYTEYIESELVNKEENDSDTFNETNIPNLKITSQMVLLCAWRTVKEICLILGEIVSRVPLKINSTQLQYMIEINQVLDVGEILKELLLESKHRGAFELAYVGFLQLCIILWKVDHTDLNNLPMKWLGDILNIIITDNIENNKICATRRGAGIPFMVQAIIISELEVKSTCTLQLCMQTLFEICNKKNIYNFVSRTHAFNILRTLYRCKELNIIINEYITDGIIVAIRGYNCSTWSEKNSATLLFSSLIIRIFGVQESKDFDPIDIKNKMTGRKFFLRYTKLYDFFLVELKIANKLIEENKSVNNLQPILLVFGRLYSTALEGTDSNLTLKMFISFLTKCSDSRDMYTRLLAAKAVASITSVDMISNQILELLGNNRYTLITKRPNFNYIHGLLLQVKYLLIYDQKISFANIENILNELNYIENAISGNIVVLKMILDIKINIMERFQETQNPLFCSHKIRSTLSLPESLSFYYPVFRQYFFVYNLHILRFQNSHSLLLKFLLIPLTTNVQYSVEEIDAVLSTITLITFKNYLHKYEVYEELDICKDLIKFIKNLNVNCLEKLYVELVSSVQLKDFLMWLIKNRKYDLKCIKKGYAICSRLDKCPFNLAETLLNSKIEHIDIRTTMAMCVEHHIMQINKYNENTLNKILNYLVDISHPSMTTLLRLRASRILFQLSKYFKKYMDKNFKKIGVNFASITLCLLIDDDFTIRNNVSKIVHSIDTIYNLPIIPTGIVPNYAQLLFIENIAKILKYKYQIEDYTFIKSFFEEIISFLVEVYLNESKTNSNIFDKIEENIYAEPTKVISDIKQIFFKYFGNNI